MRIFHTRSLNVLEKALDLASMRHTLISDNIANVNTPGFKSSDIEFDHELRSSMAGSSQLKVRRTRQGHAPGLSSSREAQIKVNTMPHRPDGNSVDIDAEMAKLAENSLAYTTYVQLVSAKLNMLRHVISEGRR